jgi:hypothetical protein
MIYFIALIPATGLTIAGYFVLYMSNRSEGAFRNFGKYLGFWAFTLAALVILGAIFAAAHCGRMHGGMRGPWAQDPRFLGPRGEAPESGSGSAPHTPDAPNPTAPR